jgi:hypothetical protein
VPGRSRRRARLCGRRIYHDEPGDLWAICTSAFIGRPNDGFPYDEFRVLTAGHCIKGATGDIGEYWQHDAVLVGIATAYQFSNHMSADVGIIDIPLDTPTNLVYGNNNVDMRPITGKKPNANQPQGAGVCRGGASSGSYACDYITKADSAVFVGGMWHDHAWEMGVASKGGDSGGPMMYDDKAFGIVSYGNTVNGVPVPPTGYSSIGYTITTFDYRPCYSGYFNPCN